MRLFKMGQTVGLLTAYAEGGYDKAGYKLWRCRCVCGTSAVLVRAVDFQKRLRRTCGECAKVLTAAMGPLTRDLIAAKQRDAKLQRLGQRVRAAKEASAAAYAARYDAVPGFAYRSLVVVSRRMGVSPSGEPQQQFVLSCECGRTDYILARSTFAAGSVVSCGCRSRGPRGKRK